MNTAQTRRMQILSGTRHLKLAQDVAKRLGVKVSQTQLMKFANGEIKCQLEESVRGADVFIFQTHSYTHYSPRGTECGDKMGDFSFGILPDFISSGKVMCKLIVYIGKLVWHKVFIWVAEYEFVGFPDSSVGSQ